MERPTGGKGLMESRMIGNFHVRFGERDGETRPLQGGKVRRVPTLQLIQMIPIEEREQFICELTKQSLEQFFEARGIESGVEASYVLHHRNSENPESPGLHDPHTQGAPVKGSSYRGDDISTSCG
jgi:hypothetical protein